MPQSRLPHLVSRRLAIGSGIAGLTAAAFPALATDAPTPYGATPSARQLAWQAMEVYAFLHFTVDTFTDRDWGLGDEDPKIFNPTDFDAEQIVTACKAGGMKQVILTAKHHDGFCLWPSRLTEHCIKNSPFQDGRGDIVRDISRACARHGLKFGVYLSPWDRNHADYGRPAYVDYYLDQLRELLTGYGPIHEVWFDGANGGDGYYGGACERREIDGATYYRWPEVYGLVRRLQPQAVMFRDYGTEVRWVGNEAGIAGDPCWPTMSGLPFTPELGNSGIRGGALWNPAEVDVSIRHSWFWHEDENERVRSPANLLKLYLTSVGRGANLLLNAPPDRRGRMYESDVQALKGFRALMDTTFSRNFNAGARISASSTFGPGFRPSNILNGGRWAATENDREGAWLQMDLSEPATFDLIRLREDTRYGVRIDDYVVEIAAAGGWREIARHTCIGAQRVIRLDAPVTAQSVRLRVTKAAASPVISEFSLYRLPEIVEDPVIVRDGEGVLTVTAPGEGLDLFYSVDGSAPSLPYAGPIAFAAGGKVRAMARRRSSGLTSAVITADYDIRKSGWSVVSCNGDNGKALLTWDESPDGDQCNGPEGQPLDAVIDLGRSYDVTGFTIQRGQWMPFGGAAPESCRVWLSRDGEDWGQPVLEADLTGLTRKRSLVRIPFANTVAGRYLRVHLPRAVNGHPFISIARIGITAGDA